MAMLEADNMPSKEAIESDHTSKVILMPLENTIREAKKISLGQSMSGALNAKLNNDGLVQVLKRVKDGKKQISNEVKMAQLAQETNIDVGQADYIISGSVNNASFDSQYHKARIEQYIKNGKKITHHISPKVTYESCVSGELKIFSLPQLKQEAATTMRACKRDSHKAYSRRDVKRRDNALMRNAGASAVRDGIERLNNFFAKKGYIIEAKRYKDKIIVKTTLGHKQGAQQRKRVDVYTIENIYNALLEKEIITEQKIASGNISNQIDENFSWIVIGKTAKGKHLHLGDYIKIRY